MRPVLLFPVLLLFCFVAVTLSTPSKEHILSPEYLRHLSGNEKVNDVRRTLMRNNRSPVRGNNNRKNDDYVCLPQDDEHPIERAAHIALRNALIEYGNVSHITDVPDYARYVTIATGILGDLYSNADLGTTITEITEATLLLQNSVADTLTSGNNLSTPDHYAQIYENWIYDSLGTYEWWTDEHFALLRMRYLPYYIERVRSSDQYEIFGNVPGVDVEDEFTRDNLYWIDYEKALHGMVELPGRYGAATAVLFVGLRGQKKGVKPVAINVKGTNFYPDPNNPKEPKWLVAKMLANCGEAHAGDMEHFYRTQLIMGPIAISALRNFHDRSPVYTFLQPYMNDALGLVLLGFRDIFHFNTIWDEFTAFGGQGGNTYLNNVWFEKTWEESWFLNDLEERGVKNLKGFTFAEIGKKFYQAYYRLCSTFVNKYYKTEQKLRDDYEVQSWLDEIKGKVGGMPAYFTKNYLKRTLTDILTRVSFVHHVTNLKTMYHFHGVLPIAPRNLYLPLNDTSFPTSYNDIVRWLPNLALSANQIFFDSLFTNRHIYIKDSLLHAKWLPRGGKLTKAQDEFQEDMVQIYKDLKCDTLEDTPSVISPIFYCPDKMPYRSLA